LDIAWGGYAAINTFQRGLTFDFYILLSTPIEDNGAFLNHKVVDNNGKTTLFGDAYKNINMPVLFITGINDSIVDSQKTFNLLNGLNKNITVHIIAGLNHYLTKSNEDWRNFRNDEDLIGIYNMDENALSKIISWTINQ